MSRLGFRKNTPKQTLELTRLSDEALASVIHKTFQGQSDAVGALFLVAYENFPVYFSAFEEAVKESAEFPPSLEGMVSFLDRERAKHAGQSIRDEASSRRYFYLLLAALLNALHARAKQKPALWEAVAAVWVALLPGARALRRVLDSTSLWTTDEIAYFKDVRTEDEGESYCLSQLVPSEIRYHSVVQDWLERDFSADVRAELGKMDKFRHGN
ncbi:MAG TPA: hypothetical protein VFJ87_03615 [Rhodanobacteraceae bacterium]|nr:hypothetical protein [Rhodanobacteraceae bacterium]